MNLGQLWGVSGGYRAVMDLGRFGELQGGLSWVEVVFGSCEGVMMWLGASVP